MWIFLRLMKRSVMDVVSTRKNSAETAPKNAEEGSECCGYAVVVDCPFEPWKSNFQQVVCRSQRIMR